MTVKTRRVLIIFKLRKAVPISAFMVSSPENQDHNIFIGFIWYRRTALSGFQKPAWNKTCEHQSHWKANKQATILIIPWWILNQNNKEPFIIKRTVSSNQKTAPQWDRASSNPSCIHLPLGIRESCHPWYAGNVWHGKHSWLVLVSSPAPRTGQSLEASSF